MSADNVVPIRPTETGVASQHDDWVPLTLQLPNKRPRITPGSYQAQAATLKKLKAYGRVTLELGFDVWAGDPAQISGDFMQDKVAAAQRLARIPLFLPWPAKTPSPNSQIARLLYLMGHTRHESINVGLLRGRWFYVEVGDQDHDSVDRKYGPEETYSIIKRVVRFLA